nr:cysteine synthase CysM [Pelistega indica]
MTMKSYPTVADTIGATPLVRLQRIAADICQKNNNIILAKLEGNNPAGSVKDRPALSMIEEAERSGKIKPGDTLIEATSGNTGIALAMAAAIKGYHMILIMPDNLSVERRVSMKVYGAELILTKASEGGMEHARDLALKMQEEGQGVVLNQFANLANPLAHIKGTGPEIWQQTEGQVSHFISAMGTTGTITGVATYLKQQRSSIQVIGAQPSPGASIPGIRKWSDDYQPEIFKPELIDAYELIGQAEAEQMASRLAKEEGIFAGISSGGALVAALRVAERVQNATIVFIICDRGNRYLSLGIY